MDDGRSTTRRSWLAAAGGTLGALAGCVAPIGANDSRDSPTGADSSPTATATEPPDRSTEGTPTAAPTSHWRTFRGDGRNTGCAMPDRGPIEDPDERWAVETEGGFWSSPVVANGTVYIGGMDYDVYAIDAASGEIRWRYPTDGPVQSTPTVRDGRVYVGSLDKHVYCLDADSGEKQWATETAGLVSSSPTIDDGTVFIGTGTIAVGEVHAYLRESGIEQEGGGMYALDAETGDVRWRRFPDRSISSKPAVVDGSVYFGTTARDDLTPLIAALDRTDGETRWRYETEWDLITSPSVVDSTVYIPSFGGTVYALTTETGEEAWTYEVETGDIRGSTAVCDGTVYVPVSGYVEEAADPALLALTDEGELTWTHRFHHARQMGASPAVTDEAVYIATHHHTDVGGMFAVSLDGERLWSIAHPTGEGVGSSPAVFDGMVYYATDEGFVYGME